MAEKRKKKAAPAPRVGDLPSSVQAARPDELPAVPTRSDLQNQINQLASTINAEVSALEEEKAAAEAETAKIETEVPIEIAVQENIAESIPDVAAGISGATAFTATDGTKFTDFENYLAYQATLDGKRQGRQSAYDLLLQEFAAYGLGSLVEPLKNLISDPTVSPSEFTIRLRQTDAYKTRFASNAKRIAKGLRAITEGEYLELEDRYQDIMRRYGLPQSYYTRGELGRQEGFEKFIEFDVSPVELEERISTAQNRLFNAPPEVMRLMSDFYGDVVSNGDALAYILDPQRALSEIQRRVTAAEIGAGAAQAGLATTRQRAEELQRFGITGEEARRGFQAVAEVAPRGGQLAEFYGESPYTQEIAEAEVFGTPGAVEARKKRERLVGREQASFAGTSGAFQGALARDRAGAL
jgi:hypothetical protein